MTALAAMPRACQWSRSCTVHGEGPYHVGAVASVFYLDHLPAAAAICQVGWMARVAKIHIKLPSVSFLDSSVARRLPFTSPMLSGAARWDCADSGRTEISSVEKLNKFWRKACR